MNDIITIQTNRATFWDKSQRHTSRTFVKTFNKKAMKKNVPKTVLPARLGQISHHEICSSLVLARNAKETNRATYATTIRNHSSAVL